MKPRSNAMPSTYSTSVWMPFDSSTVITPSLPTFSIVSPMSSPMVGSLFAEMDATCAICSRAFTLIELRPTRPTTASAPFSRPRFSDIGFAPAATFFRPSCTIAWPTTVAVVVPSPAMSFVLEAISLASWAPIFSNASSSSMSRAIVTPSFVIVGAPNFLSSTTLRPFGPSVILTASASASMPRFIAWRASSSKSSCFAMYLSVPLPNFDGAYVSTLTARVLINRAAPPAYLRSSPRRRRRSPSPSPLRVIVLAATRADSSRAPSSGSSVASSP